MLLSRAEIGTTQGPWRCQWTDTMCWIPVPANHQGAHLQQAVRPTTAQPLVETRRHQHRWSQRASRKRGLRQWGCLWMQTRGSTAHHHVSTQPPCLQQLQGRGCRRRTGRRQASAYRQIETQPRVAAQSPSLPESQDPTRIRREHCPQRPTWTHAHTRPGLPVATRLHLSLF